MTLEEDATHKIYLPPQAIDPNTQRMAWLLFLECWKTMAPNSLEKATGMWPEWVEHAYGDCLEAAKIVRKLEQEKG